MVQSFQHCAGRTGQLEVVYIFVAIWDYWWKKLYPHHTNHLTDLDYIFCLLPQVGSLALRNNEFHIEPLRFPILVVAPSSYSQAWHRIMAIAPSLLACHLAAISCSS